MSKTYQRRLVVRVGTRQLEAFDCSFAVTRTLDYSQNTAQIQIYGLSYDTRRELQLAGSVNCEVLAGYADDPTPARLFLGDLRVISSKRQGPEWITSIESGDGDIVKQTQVTGAWPAGTSTKQIIADIGVQLGQAGASLFRRMDTLVDKPTDGPVAVHERGDETVATLLDTIEADHSWQDGELQIVKRNEAAGGVAVLLTPSTGLLDSPEIQGIRGFARQPILTARSLLNPNIRPGGMVQIVSGSWSGLVHARRVSHTGQSWGGEWTTEIEALVSKL